MFATPTFAAGTKADPDLVDPSGDGTRNDVIAAWFTYVDDTDMLLLSIQFAQPPLDPHPCNVDPNSFRESHYISFHFHVYDENLALLGAKDTDANLTWFRFVTNRICDSQAPRNMEGRTFTNVGITNENRTQFNSLGRTNQTIREDVMTVQIDPKTLRLPFNAFLPGYRVTNITIDTFWASFLGSGDEDKAPDDGFGRNMSIGQRPGTARGEDLPARRAPRALGAEGTDAPGIPDVTAMLALVTILGVASLRHRPR